MKVVNTILSLLLLAGMAGCASHQYLGMAEDAKHDLDPSGGVKVEGTHYIEVTPVQAVPYNEYLQDKTAWGFRYEQRQGRFIFYSLAEDVEYRQSENSDCVLSSWKLIRKKTEQKN